MDDLFTLHSNGLFLRREALAHGYRDRDLANARHGGAIARIRQGAYVPRETWNSADDLARHRLRAQAVVHTHGNKVALSHTSGAAEHGLRMWKPDLSKVHVTRLDKTSARRLPDVVYHSDTWNAEDVFAKDEGLVLGPETCALGAAALTTVSGGVAILDSVYDLDLGSEESLWGAYSRRKRSPHTRKLQLTIRLARPGAQSLGESLSRSMMWSQHLPEPELQFKVYDDHGTLIGITDFAWPALRLLGEFDGKIKYGRLLLPGEQPGDAVFREKNREDRLREATGFMMIRYIWDNLSHPRESAARTRRMMHLAVAS
ncbi:MAG: hypothetical protein ABWX73_15205 [Marmoricola sp.]